MMNLMNAPVPGQSLTKDPSSRSPWEMPPKFNTVNQSCDHLFKTITSKAFIQNYDTILKEDKKVYVDEIVAGMLSEGFINGLWTVDIMMLLVEPLTSMMVWAAAQLDRSPTFSTDTGFEERTGFETLSDLVGEVDASEVETMQQAPEMEAEEAPQEAPESPLISEGPQSPLVTGGVL